MGVAGGSESASVAAALRGVPRQDPEATAGEGRTLPHLGVAVLHVRCGRLQQGDAHLILPLLLHLRVLRRIR